MNVIKCGLTSQGDIQVSFYTLALSLQFLLNLFQSAFALPWIRFLEPNDLFSLLSSVSDAVNNTPEATALGLLEAILAALKMSPIKNPETLGQRLGQLLGLRSVLGHSSVLEDMIAEAVSTCLPVAHHGRPSDGPIIEASSLQSSVTFAEMRWNHHLDLSPEVDIQTFLVQQSWTGSTVRIVSDLLYKQAWSREAYLHWLGTDHRTSATTQELAMTLYAYLDAAIQQEDAMGDAECEILASQFWSLLSSKQTYYSLDVLPTCAALLFLIIKRSSLKPKDHLSVLLKRIQSKLDGQLGPGYLVLGRRLRGLFHHDADDVVTYIVDYSLQRVVRLFSSGTDEWENTLKFSDELGVSIIR